MFWIYIFRLHTAEQLYWFSGLQKEAIKKLGMRANTCSFNPGVFVANLTEWKQQNITSQLEFWMERNAKLVRVLLYCYWKLQQSLQECQR